MYGDNKNSWWFLSSKILRNLYRFSSNFNSQQIIEGYEFLLAMFAEKDPQVSRNY